MPIRSCTSRNMKEKDFFYKIQVWLEKTQLIVSADVVMATNASYKNLAITRGGLAPEDVFIVRNGPDLETFKPVPPVASAEVRQTLPCRLRGNHEHSGRTRHPSGCALNTSKAQAAAMFTSLVSGEARGFAGLRQMVKDRIA